MQLNTAPLYCDVIAQRSFSKAASLNQLSQSLVSQAIRSPESWLPEHPTANQRSTDVENVKRSVEIDSGVALVLLQPARRKLEHASLRAVKLQGVDWNRPLGVVQKRNRKLTIATSRFVELLLEKKSPRRKPSTKRGTRNTPATRLLAG